MRTRTPGRLAFIAIALIGLAIVAVYFLRDATLVLDAPRPVLVADTVDSLPPMPVSVIEAPITYDLESVIDSLEGAVPLVYGDLDVRYQMKRSERMHYAFLLQRSPFRVRMNGQTVTIAADVEYSGKVWYAPPIGPEIEVACGTDEDLPRRATLAIESKAELTRGWELRTRSRVVRLAALSDSARDRCRLTFLRLDVTDQVMEKAQELLDRKLGVFDSVVARWPVRPRFEKMWRDLQKPVRLADSIYMSIHPSQAQIGSIGATGKTAYANLRLFATPRIVTGPKPIREPEPLPPLERASDVGRGARVLLDASFTYPIATAMLHKALVGRIVEQSGHKIRIRDVRLTGIGGGRVALGVRVSGAVRGRIFFTGTPGYDVATRQIMVPDLDYDAGTVTVLVKGYEWLNGMQLRDFLRERARLPDSAVVSKLADLAEDGMNRKLPARGTWLSGRIDQAGVIAVRATRDEIRVRALADADLELTIDRAPSIPRLREPKMKPGDDIVTR